MFNSKIGIGVLKHPGYNGKGGSTSTATDFFGVGKRAPYEELLGSLLLGGDIGATKGYYAKGQGGDKNGRTYVPGQPGVSLTDFIQSRPGYMFGMDQGQQAVERSFQAQGFGHSGNEDLALQNYGNQYAGQYLQQLIGNVVGPSGATMGAGQNSQTSAPGIGGDIAGAFASFALSKLPTSDKNLKTNIKHINTINGIKIYSFNYIWSYLKSVGVMAQDLLEMPEYKHAVHTTNIGYVVDYSKLPI